MYDEVVTIIRKITIYNIISNRVPIKSFSHFYNLTIFVSTPKWSDTTNLFVLLKITFEYST